MSTYNGPPPPKESSCIGKSPFDTFQKAAERAKIMRQKKRLVTPYKCPHCHAYHVGKPRVSKRREKLAEAD